MQLALGGPVVIKSIGPVNLYLFGTAAAAGCVAGLAAALALARRYGFAAEQVLEVAAPALLAGIAGARIGYVLLHWPDYRWDLAALWRLSEGGFFFYGGLAVGLLAAALAAGRRGMDVRRLLDVLAPGLALGQAVGFVGAQPGGRPGIAPWAVVIDGQSLHPFPAYAIVAAYGLFFVCWRLATRPGGVRPGRLFLAYLFLHGTGALLLGAWAAGERYAGLTAAQWAGLAVAATAGLLLYAGRRRTAAELLAAAAWLEPWVPDWRSRSAAGRAVRAAAWAGGLLLLLALFRARL